MDSEAYRIAGLVVSRLIALLNALTVALLAIIAVGAVYFAGTSPVAYQKIMSLRPLEGDVPTVAEGDSLDVARFIGAIPYRSSEGIIEVYPERLYERTVLEGRGNCANKTRGLTFYLNRRGIPFHRVDLIPFDGYLDGRGHTLARTRFMLDGVEHVGLVDMLDGGVLMMRDRLIDIDDLRFAAPYSITIRPLNNRVDNSSDYYGSFIETAAVSTTPMEQTQRFFRFLEAVYLPLGDPRLERLVFQAGAVICGVFPRHYVSEDDYQRLLEGNREVLVVAQTLTWAARLLPICLILQVVLRLRRLAARWGSRRGPRVETSTASAVAAGTTDGQGAGVVVRAS